MFALVFFAPIAPVVRLGEFQCIKLSLIKHKCAWANSRRGKTVCKSRLAKITRGFYCSFNMSITKTE